MIKISAIIATYNRAHFLDGLFNSIINQSIPFSEYEIIIVNNNSTDETESKSKELINNYPELNVKYCVENQQGLSYGRNRGIAESEGNIVTFVDDDAILSTSFFEKTIQFFHEHPKVNAIGGKILLKHLTDVPKWYNPYLASLLGYFNLGDEEQLFINNYFRGSNMSFRLKLFSEHEAFNVQLGRVGRQLYGNEEKELFYRLKEAGEEMWYVPSTIVYHLVPQERTTSSFIKKQAIGTGISQAQHAKVKGSIHLVIAIVKELLKWFATLILAVFYILWGKIAVAKMLIYFRAWVSYGILCQNSAAKLL